MIIKYGDMWELYSNAELFLITANSSVGYNDKLIMGAGIAKEACDRFPGIDLALGKTIKKTCGHLGLYGLMVSPFWPSKKFGLFQTKADWRNKSNLRLIAYSTNRLNHFIRMNRNPINVHLNYPGIGYGGLLENDVYEIIKSLPDCVTIWKK